MATTTNFGWPTPDNTSYVRNGASDMRTLGSAIDTSMADLKGGTTGQVLKKNTNTDMDFVWAAESGVEFVAGKNKILNGDFGIWQRGAGAFTNAGGYTADRWLIDADGGTFSATRSAFIAGTAPVAGYESQYYLTVAMTTGGNAQYIVQRIEDVRTFAGQTVTLSYWAKANTSVSSTPIAVQNFGTGGSADVNTFGSAVTIGTSWARYTQVFTLPSIAGKTINASNYLALQVIRTSTASTVDLWGVQLEAGSVATPFTTATGNPASELAACQRYYFRNTGNTDSNYSILSAGGVGKSSTIALIPTPCPVTMRRWPTSIDFSNIGLYDGTTLTTVTSVSGSVAAWNSSEAAVEFTVASGLTQYRPYMVMTTSTTGYLGFSAEL